MSTPMKPMTSVEAAATIPRLRNWREVVKRLESDPGTWYLVAEDAAVSMASYLRRQYGLEVRTKGVGSAASRCAALYARASGDQAPVEAPEPGRAENAREAAAQALADEALRLISEMRESPRAEARDFQDDIDELEQKVHTFTNAKE